MAAAATRRAEFAPGPGRQRGAIGLFGALTLLLALLFTTLSVDAGRLWYEQRQLQKVADMAALEAASRLGRLGCGAGVAAGNVTAAAQAAAERNGFGGKLNAAPSTVEVGGLTSVAGLRRFNPGAGSEAVRVVATQAVPASLVLGGLFGQSALLRAEATAEAEPSQAAFSVGSYLLRISANNADANLLNLLLGGILGSSLSLDAVSYKGLASADVNLAQLVRASATVGSVEELLSANLSVADVIGLTVTAVSQQGVVDATVTAGLQELLHASMDNMTLNLGDVLNVQMPNSEAAATASINVFDLVTTTILVANRQHAVSLPLAVNVGSLLNVNLLVNLIEPPQIAVGPAGRDAAGNWCAQARTAQVDVRATVQANVLGLANIDLGLGAQLAQSEAHVEDIDVVPGAARVVIGATPGIAALTLTNAAGTGPASVKALGLTLATIGLNLPIQASNPSDLTYDVAAPVADHLPVTQSVSASVGDSLANALSDPHAIDLDVLPGLGLLGGLLDAILDPVLSQVLAPLLGGIGSAVLDPLLKLLGIQLGGADVTLQHIEAGRGARLVI